MELPFAVTEETNFPPPAPTANRNSNSISNSNGALLQPQQPRPRQQPQPQPQPGTGGGGGGVQPLGSPLQATPVALYDNVHVHTEHFYTPNQPSNHAQNQNYQPHQQRQPHPQPHQNQPYATQNYQSQSMSQSKIRSPVHDLAESTFVTIGNEHDYNGGYSNIHKSSQPQPQMQSQQQPKASSSPSSSASSDYYYSVNDLRMFGNNHNGTTGGIGMDMDMNMNVGDVNILTGEGSEYISIGLNSYKERQSQNQNQNQVIHRDKQNAPFDVLSLLISSCCDPPIVSSTSTSTSTSTATTNEKETATALTTTNTNTNTNTTNFVQLCQGASNEATTASKLTQKGDISNAIQQHTTSATKYKDAAIILKRNFGTDMHMALLAYSLLVLSNSQQRAATALLRGGFGAFGSGSGSGSTIGIGIGIGGIGMNNGLGSGNGAGVGTDLKNNNSMDVNARNSDGTNTRSGNPTNEKKEQRLRAKIRASMNRAEADMTDSMFLSKGDTIPSSDPIPAVNAATGNGNGSNKSNHTTTTTGMANPATNVSTHHHKIVNSNSNNAVVNPVDDMMELEKELRDMDMTLEMGVGLGSSSTANNNNNNINTVGGGSFCVVPGGSSYMASSMMWSSGIGGRAQQAPSQQQQQQNGTNTIVPHNNNNNSRNRANRLNKTPTPGQYQHNNTIIAPAPKQQTPQPTSLEASWWGQASALASSTTSLSNSMVGIRSPNVMAQQQQIHGMDNASAAPANTKQLMRLLDSLKTLGDENASLMREVEEAQKARLEAKAAREAMKQFKDEYGKRFATLKAALEKFRSEYPERNGGDSAKNGSSTGSSHHNIVAKSDFVKANTIAEMQMRDQMIKKLTMDLNKVTMDLKKEKADSKKKDDALRKYENFYREVKARSAQKAKQREEEQRRKNLKK